MTNSVPVDSGAATLPQSPHAMAQAVLDEAIAERDRQSERGVVADDAPMMTDGAREVDPSTSNKRPHTDETYHDGAYAKDSLKKMWEGAGSNEWTEDMADEALEATTALVHGQIELLVRSGLEAYHGWESTKRKLLQMEEEQESTTRELKRLRASEEQSRATITVRIFFHGIRHSSLLGRGDYQFHRLSSHDYQCTCLYVIEPLENSRNLQI